MSLLAPFAVITLGERIGYDNGDTVEPALESYLVNIDGSPIEPVAHFQEMVAAEEFSQLMAAQHKIAEIVETQGATVLLEEEWKEHVPRLRAGDGVAARDPLHVLDALFFEGV